MSQFDPRGPRRYRRGRTSASSRPGSGRGAGRRRGARASASCLRTWSKRAGSGYGRRRRGRLHGRSRSRPLRASPTIVLPLLRPAEPAPVDCPGRSRSFVLVGAAAAGGRQDGSGEHAGRRGPSSASILIADGRSRISPVVHRSRRPPHGAGAALAREAAEHGDVPIGAVVARGDEVLGEGGNQRERRSDPTAHAEVLAIREASEALGGWRLPARRST